MNGLNIRGEQLRAFDENTERELVEALIAHLREYHAGAVAEVPDELLVRRVRAGVARARAYELADSSMAFFVALLFEVGERFDEQPRIREILSNLELPDELRVELLLKWTGGDDWEQARRLSLA